MNDSDQPCCETCGEPASTHVGIDLSATADKAGHVLADTGAGAAFGGAAGVALGGGALSWLTGPVGGYIGGAAGAIYGVIDQFGGDVHDLLNPPHFTEDDYNRMRAACVASGGQPTAGIAPDNYGGCTYASPRAVSGGDHPFPGSWNGEVRDPAAFAAAGGQQNAPKICTGPFGVPIPCAALPPPPPPPAPPAPPRNLGAPMPTVKPRRVFHVAKLSTAKLDPALAARAKGMASLISSAHNTLLAVKVAPKQNASLASGIAKLVQRAETEGGPAALHAGVLEHAQKMQTVATYVHYWLYGDGAAKVAQHAAGAR